VLAFVDGRSTLPRHPTKRYSTRSVEDIAGGVAHQTAGGDDPVATAVYSVSPGNHIAADGIPGMPYTFFIRFSGEVWWCNDLEARTWSQGGHGSPVPGTSANGNFVAIALGGDFDAPGYDGRHHAPTFAQLHSLLALWAHLTGDEQHPALPAELYGVLPCPVEALWGHHLFGKPTCPGTVVATLADAIRSHLVDEAPPTSIQTDADWQRALAALGFYTGSIDGLWGPKSRAALADFQRSRSNLVVDGLRGPMSRGELEKAVAALED